MRNQIMERQDGPILAAYNVTAAATCPPWWSPFFADGLLQLFFPSFFHGILNLLFVIFASIFVDLFTVVPPPLFFFLLFLSSTVVATAFYVISLVTSSWHLIFIHLLLRPIARLLALLPFPFYLIFRCLLLFLFPFLSLRLHSIRLLFPPLLQCSVSYFNPDGHNSHLVYYYRLPA